MVTCRVDSSFFNTSDFEARIHEAVNGLNLITKLKYYNIMYIGGLV